MVVETLDDRIRDAIKEEEGIRLRGSVRSTVRDLQGRIVSIRAIDNLWVNVGKDGCLNLLGKQAGTEGWGFTSIGTSTATPTSGDDKLGIEVGRRPIITSTVSTAQSTVQSSFYEVNYPDTTYDITEWALWLGGTLVKDSGTLFSRATGAAQQKVTGTNTLTLDWTVGA